MGKKVKKEAYCCCTAISICTSGGARAGDSTKCKLASLHNHNSQENNKC